MMQQATEKEKGHAEHTQVADSTYGLPGNCSRPVKIIVLGCGSGFTHPLVSDLLQIPGNIGGEVALVDIDKDRLGLAYQLVQKLIKCYQLEDRWQVTASSQRTDVLSGTDYIINCIEVSGVDCVAWDNDIPLQYGVDQCIGDTIGPGGLFKALRTVPVFLDILKDVQQLCPDAIVLNYTNPMNIMCLASGRVSNLRLIGLCHSVQGTSHQLAKYAQVPYEELRFDCAGINHLAWFTMLQHQGRDLYPLLREQVESHSGELYECDPVRFDVMLHFGAFVTESSGHLSEYLPYYRKRPELITEYCRSGYKGGSRFYASSWPDWRKNTDNDRKNMISGEKEIAKERSWEYASWIIESIEKNCPYRIHANVLNQVPGQYGMGRGQLITNLPADGCVEVACFVDGSGIAPTRYGALPPQMAHICESNMAMFDLAATACIEKSKEAAIHSLMLDPLTAAVCCPDRIKQMAMKLFDAEKDYLPGFK